MQFEVQAVHCVVGLVDQSEELAVQVQPHLLKSTLASLQETEHRLNQTGTRPRVLG